jgi:hypothetical protein
MHDIFSGTVNDPINQAKLNNKYWKQWNIPRWQTTTALKSSCKNVWNALK